MEKKNLFWILALIAIGTLVLVGAFIIFSQPETPVANQADFGISTDIPRGLTEDGYHFLGDDDAQLTVIVYEDYGCAACAKFKKDYELRLSEEYIATGKIKLVINPVAIVSSQISIPALEALYCADSFGYYWEFRHLLFFNLPYGLDQGKFVAFATLLEIEKTDFIGCLTSDKFNLQIGDQNAKANNKGVVSTPMFEINGELKTINQYYSSDTPDNVSLVTLIESALNE